MQSALRNGWTVRLLVCANAKGYICVISVQNNLIEDICILVKQLKNFVFYLGPFNSDIGGNIKCHLRSQYSSLLQNSHNNYKFTLECKQIDTNQYIRGSSSCANWALIDRLLIKDNGPSESPNMCCICIWLHISAHNIIFYIRFTVYCSLVLYCISEHVLVGFHLLPLNSDLFM